MPSLSNECIPENSSAPTTKTEVTTNDQQAKQHPKSHPKGKLFRRNLSSRSLLSGKASAKITPSNHEYHRSASRISVISDTTGLDPAVSATHDSKSSSPSSCGSQTSLLSNKNKPLRSIPIEGKVTVLSIESNALTVNGFQSKGKPLSTIPSIESSDQKGELIESLTEEDSLFREMKRKEEEGEEREEEITQDVLHPISSVDHLSLPSQKQPLDPNGLCHHRSSASDDTRSSRYSSSHSLYPPNSYFFEDGVRMIDFILVYKKEKFEKVHDLNKKLIRKKFEENLIDEGLEFEHTKGNESGLKFVKIHAPWEVLIRYAEVMKLKMPMKQIETSWRLVFDDEDAYSKGKFTAPFSRDKMYLFHIPTQKERFFSPSQRSQIVDFILKRKTYASNSSDAASFGINKLLQDGVYLACYPLHEGLLIPASPPKTEDAEAASGNHQDLNNNEHETGVTHSSHSSINMSPRMKLVTQWASFKNMFKKQPLDDIREYFGVKISLYFAWLGFYTSMLIPASFVGVLCFCYGWYTLRNDKVIKEICSEQFDSTPMCPLCSIKCGFWKMSDSCAYAQISHLFDNPATVFFAVFMSVWATVYLEMWKRYSARITYRWDLSNFDKFEEYPRPEYLAKLSRGEKKRLNLITKMYEPYVPFWKKQLPHTILSGGVVFFLVLVALVSVVGVIVYRVALRTLLSRSQDDKVVDYSTLITSSTAAGINLACIIVFNLVYGRIAYYLTELEMPRTQTDFENSLTLKMYLLQFVNYYSSIFYIAFFKGRFVNHPGDLTDDGSFSGRTQEECGTGGCLVELAIQLAIIMVGKQALNALVEMSQPWIEWLIHKWKLRKRALSGEPVANIPQWEDDFILSHWGSQALFYEYLEMVLQFGFVTIFVAAFPLAPLFALINNVLEIRMDAMKMISTFRRPVAQRVKNIGIWYGILDSIGKMSVLTNAVIIAFTSDFIPRTLYYAKNSSMIGYLNSTLSSYKLSQLEEMYHNKTEIHEMIRKGTSVCWYQGNRHPPGDEHEYQPNYEYWELLTMRLAFVFAFENIIAITTMLLRWIIPDVPATLRQNIRQHEYLTSELIMQQELKRAKEMNPENLNHTHTAATEIPL